MSFFCAAINMHLFIYFIYLYSENAGKESLRTWRRRKDTLGVFSLYAKRHKSVNIFVNNNTNVKIFWILSIYTIWDGLSQKTLSLYCPFKGYQLSAAMGHR